MTTTYSDLMKQKRNRIRIVELMMTTTTTTIVEAAVAAPTDGATIVVVGGVAVADATAAHRRGSIFHFQWAIF